MEIREATLEDADRIRAIAHDSLRSSYTDFLPSETIDEAVAQWYDDDALADEIDDENALVLVVEDDGDVVAFSQTELVGDGHTTGRILWLHVDPDRRGDGVGVRLLARTREELLEEGAAEIHGVVLEKNELGNEFYATHGFERAGTREIEVGEERYTENVYVGSDLERTGEWRALETVDANGERLYVSYGEPARGSHAPFYTAYEDEDGTERYGWFCGNCDSFDTAMDAMGRVECNDCGNRRKATRWDASYL
ncbi:GNAT family N-acetyltransferase [Natrialbaceae archaeon AArc-T1-2]|uniref:GNAT family N-acetyltransferase n=1 Tax=Natrialbaceae archaeon AArc-T1-2 TaxID=3053904 RepID=UPI00255AF657|nr:GNAT family N-acetyltransferase [Natrialbaceae archaeon AArc-T1-2]WIV66846.1 GNAT family N-acetyltransferase [Natrialbaceae archaeon AArc-T1-2]